MPLTGLVKHAGKIYQLNKGTRSVIRSIQDIDEKELPRKILDLPKRPDIGTGLSKNLTEILILTVYVFLGIEPPTSAKSEIDKLSEIQLPYLKSGGLTSYIPVLNMLVSADSELESEYKSFITSSKNYIDAIVRERKQLEEESKEKIQKTETAFSEMKKQLAGFSVEFTDIKRQLAAKEDELQKTKETKIDPQIAQKVRKYLSLELKFQKSFASLTTPDPEAKEIYGVLHNVLTKCLNRRSDSEAEHKIDLPNAEFLAKIAGLISKYSQSDKNAMNHKIFFTNAQSLIKELDLNKIPKDISLHDLEIYRVCAMPVSTGMPFLLPWSHAMRGLFASQQTLISPTPTIPAAEVQTGLEFDL